MAARGSKAKEIVFDKLKEVFPDAFMADAKVMRIPIMEDGETVEIKVSLVAAKDILGGGATSTVKTTEASSNGDFDVVSLEPTEEEKATVASFLTNLGL